MREIQGGKNYKATPKRNAEWPYVRGKMAVMMKILNPVGGDAIVVSRCCDAVV